MNSNALSIVKRWADWCIRTGQTFDSAPWEQFVNDILLAYAESLTPDDDGWFPIASLPEGRHVLLYWEKGERGNGGVETAMAFNRDGVWSYWTHGGPNSGVDFDMGGEPPSRWKPYNLPTNARPK